MKQRFIAAVWLFFMCTICAAGNTPITNQMLVEHQRYINMLLDPTGNYVTYAFNLHGKPSVMVQQIDNGQVSSIPLPENLNLAWTNWNHRGDMLYLVLLDTKGKMQLYAWDREKQKLTIPLDKKWEERSNFGIPSNFFAFSMLRFIDEQTGNVADFNPDDGRLYPVQNRKSSLPAYWKSPPPELRFAYLGGDFSWVLGNNIVLSPTGLDKRMGTYLVSATPDLRRAWFLTSVDQDKLGLASVDLKTGAITNIANRDADIRQVLLHPVKKSPVGFIWGREQNHFELLDKSYQNDVNHIRRTLRGEFNIVHISANNQFMLVEKYGAVSTRYRYDRKTRVLTHIALQTTPNDADLLPTQAQRFKARDGLELSVFVTPPARGTCESAQCPMIFLLHGGPSVRDYSTTNMERNWLASRGYFVAHVNYRGSSGYGKHFQNMDIGNWGGKMQEDVEDALAYVLKKYPKIAPDKVGIEGGSFGGHLVLNALGRTKQFQCGTAIVAGPDLVQFVESMAVKTKGTTDLYLRAGDPRTPEGREALIKASPLSREANISAPILLINGAKDPLNDLVNSVEFTQKVVRHAPLTYIAFNDEGHNITQANNQLIMAYLVERFFAKCLGGAVDNTAHISFSKEEVSVFYDTMKLLEGVAP
jgi:dipeptidyl aminopeptidase/acylaminoacyl peptidase